MSVCLLLAGASAPVSAQGDGAPVDPVVVSATRTETPVSETTRSVTVVDREEIEEQASIDPNLSSILGNTVPGFGPSNETVSNFGQTLRGRNYLVLIDGIPQSTPLREIGRDLNSIAPSSIERIEVVRGGTAAYGFGATGGLVNIITREPTEGPTEGYSEAGARFSTEHFEDSGEYATEHRISGTEGDWDYVFSGSFIERNGRFDADGRRIPPDPLGTQGGFADTTEYSLLAKAGYDFDGGDQRIEAMLNHFNNEQDTDYTVGTELEDGRTPAVRLSEAAGDAVPFRDPGTENTTGRLTYRHRDLGGSTLDLSAYYGELDVIFPKFPGFEQGQNISEKHGARATVTTPLALAGQAASVIWGLDYLADETVDNRFAEQGEVASDTPRMDQDAYAAFIELEQPLGDIGVLRGGVRHEEIAVDTTTVASNRFGNRVEAGTLDYDETLFNASAVFFVSDAVDVFGSFSQGFSIADVGRVIRGAGDQGGGETLSADQFETEAEKVDNYEIGLRWYAGDLQATAAAFYSTSDNGTTYDQDLRIQKFKEDIYGFELAADYRVNERFSVGGTFSKAEGERENTDGSLEALDSTRIAPEKLTAHADYAPGGTWRHRLQALYVNDRDDVDGPFGLYPQGDVESYTLVDLLSRVDLGPGTLRVSVRNLLNEDYSPAINQAFNIPTASARGPGRTIGLSYGVNW